jgi:hypothetical protein
MLGEIAKAYSLDPAGNRELLGDFRSRLTHSLSLNAPEVLRCELMKTRLDRVSGIQIGARSHARAGL